MKNQFLILGILFCLFSCKKAIKKSATVQKEKITLDTISNEKKDLSNFHIFDLYTIENGNKQDIFISLSDIYNDSLAIPEDFIQNQKTKNFADLKHFELTGNYREKLLKGTSLSESDTLFLYNYKESKLEKFPIRDLKSVANLNLYSSEGDEISSYDYMIGFQLNKYEKSDESAYEKSNFSLAYFGKENPFSGEKMVPIHWKKTSRDQFPLPLKNQKNLGETYLAKFDDLTYYIQDYKDEYGISKRDFAVVEGKKVVFMREFAKGEGAEFTALNFIDKNEDNNQQRTGKLFKNKPPVVFGFVSQSFGCEAINFLNNSYPLLYIDCDNRH